MIDIKSSNVRYDYYYFLHCNHIKKYVAHVVNLGARMDLFMLINITNITKINHKV